MEAQSLDYGNCATVRLGGKEAYVKVVSLRTETSYKADAVDKLAQHSEVLGSHAVEVNDEIVRRQLICLPREALSSCDAGLNLPCKRSGLCSNAWIQRQGVSRGHSSLAKRVGSSRRWVDPSDEESGGLRQDEGPNLRSGTDQ